MKLKASYEKTALSLSIVTAIGLGTALYVSAGKVKRDFDSAPSARQGLPLLAAEDRIRAAGRGDEGNDFLDLASPNIFTGHPHFVVKGRGSVVDLADPAVPAVHPPIPNRWWLQHGIDPGFADSPQRDADRDGFSNLEEFQAGTNPVAFKSHPPLVGKLRVVGLADPGFRLNYTSDTCVGDPNDKDWFGFRYLESDGDRNRQIEIPAGRGVASIFFEAPPAQGRFELKEVRLDNVQGRNVYTAIVEDHRKNKRGRTYQIRKGSRHGLVVRDYTATFALDAVRQSSHHFEVEENTSFSLPYDPDAKAKPFRFKEVREGPGGRAVVIEFREAGQPVEMVLPVAE